MADQARSSIRISAAPEAVLGVIADLERYPEWTGAISGVEVLQTGADGPAKARFTMSASGLADQYVLDYTWRADGVSWVLAEPTKLQKSQQGSYVVTPDGDGAQVTYLLTLESKMPMIGLMKRKAERMIIDSALKELKKRVESLR